MLKWNKKAAEQLEKLNRDCNMTAGLEAKLSLAVGTQVMLCHNIDTETSLVNGAIGTVLSISVNCVMVQFDHISEPYDVEMVRSRFMVMKNFYVYRKQFPLILAYAVTIHKLMSRFVTGLCHHRPLRPSFQCQGLITFGGTPRRF